MRNRRLQVVRDDDLRRPAIEVEGVLAGVDEVLLLLGPDGFDIGKLGAREDGDEHFHRDLLPSLPVREVQPVPGEVHVHPVAGLVLQVCDGGGLDQVGLEDAVEPAPGIAVREFLLVLFIDLEFGHALLAEPPGVLGHARHGLVVALGLSLVSGRFLLEDAQKLGVVHGEDFLDGLAASVEDVDVFLHGVP